MTDSPAQAAVPPATVLERGRSLLDAQRQAMLASDLERLGTLNRQLADWFVELGPALAGLASDSTLRTQLHSALQVNAAVAARASADTQRALATLLPAAVPTYRADGRSSAPNPPGRPFSA